MASCDFVHTMNTMKRTKRTTAPSIWMKTTWLVLSRVITRNVPFTVPGTNTKCTAPDVIWCRFRKILIILCFCPHIHGFLSMLSSPEIQQHAGSQEYNIGKKRSLNAKTNIICETVSCCCCIQFKYRIRHIDPTVWQAKENVLRKIPCCMYGKRTPETVHVIYHEGKQNSDQKNIQDRKHRNSVIARCSNANSSAFPTIATTGFL